MPTTTLEMQQAIETGISAIRTPLGWMLEGAVSDKAEGTCFHLRGQELENVVLNYINEDIFGLGP